MSIPVNPEIPAGTAVEVYWNLHKHLFSVRSRGARPRVLGHFTEIHLMDVTFRVSQKLREKVLAEKRKNVHAFVRGTVAPDELHLRGNIDNYARISYNPYRNPEQAGHFYEVETEQPLRGAAFVRMVAQTNGHTNRALILGQRVKPLDTAAAA